HRVDERLRLARALALHRAVVALCAARALGAARRSHRRLSTIAGLPALARALAPFLRPVSDRAALRRGALSEARPTGQQKARDDEREARDGGPMHVLAEHAVDQDERDERRQEDVLRSAPRMRAALERGLPEQERDAHFDEPDPAAERERLARERRQA